jgi:hypothetical protein
MRVARRSVSDWAAAAGVAKIWERSISAGRASETVSTKLRVACRDKPLLYGDV